MSNYNSETENEKYNYKHDYVQNRYKEHTKSKDIVNEDNLFTYSDGRRKILYNLLA